MLRRDPVLHSHVEDVLPDDHSLAWQSVYCDGEGCEKMLHAFNNECMQTWIETGKGNFCVACFAKVDEVCALENDWGLEVSRQVCHSLPTEMEG